MSYSLHNIIFDMIDLNINEDQIIEWVVKNYTPEEIFTTKILDNWALDNGYVKDE